MTKAQKVLKRETLVVCGFLAVAGLLQSLQGFGPVFPALRYFVLAWCYPAHVITKIALWQVRTFGEKRHGNKDYP